jgi:hypothetical protein
VAESPVKPGIIWVGADDGKVQVTLNGGASWLDRTAKIAAAGGPADFWVSRVFASPHDAATAFVTKTGWRFDDFRPCLYKTTDYGETWRALDAGLPRDRSLNVVIQDRLNPGLLFVGTEQGVFVSFDGGMGWQPFKGNMPWVKVTDLVIHPRENDLVVATYGRGLYIMDIAPLQELGPDVLAKDVHLFAIEPRTQYLYGGIGNYQLLGDSHIFSPNEPNAVVVTYYLKAKATDKAKVKIADAGGEVVAELTGPAEAGLNRVLWDIGSAPRVRGAEFRAAACPSRDVLRDPRSGTGEVQREGRRPRPRRLDRRPRPGQTQVMRTFAFGRASELLWWGGEGGNKKKVALLSGPGGVLLATGASRAPKISPGAGTSRDYPIRPVLSPR